MHNVRIKYRIRCTYDSLQQSVAVAHMDHFDHCVINSVATSVHYVNGIHDYVMKATYV